MPTNQEIISEFETIVSNAVDNQGCIDYGSEGWIKAKTWLTSALDKVRLEEQTRIKNLVGNKRRQEIIKPGQLEDYVQQRIFGYNFAIDDILTSISKEESHE